MLYGNKSFVNTKFVAGALGGLDTIGKNNFTSNGLAFGSKTSVPQGYTSVPRGITPTLQTSGNITARLNSEYTLDGDLRATGNVAAGATIETSMTAFGNVLGNIYATAVAAISMSADLKGRGNMEANIDWAARPSAFDIAQEVMNFTLDGFTYQDIVKLQAAILLGKVSGGGSATETFRDISDTKDRVVATVDASGNRTAITLDAD